MPCGEYGLHVEWPFANDVRCQKTRMMKTSDYKICSMIYWAISTQSL